MSSVYCRMAPGDPLHGLYHDTECGFPTDNESVLFERLMLEINQAGLSWATILRKRAAFRAAFADFVVDRVAAFGPAEFDRLPADPGIIRNRLKIEAATENARRLQALRQSHGSFMGWLEAHHPCSAEDWTKLFRRTFRDSVLKVHQKGGDRERSWHAGDVQRHRPVRGCTPCQERG